MTFRPVQLTNVEFRLIEIVIKIYIKNYPMFEERDISKRRAIKEALIYYIKTEKDFAHYLRDIK